MKKLLTFCIMLLASQNVLATDPMNDRLHYEGNWGSIATATGGRIDIPYSEQLSTMQRSYFENRSCTAPGEPVANLKLDNDKLYLLDLYDCSGDIPLSKIYPELKQPLLANWLTGTYRANFNYLCRNKKNQVVTEFEHVLVVNKGVVTIIMTTNNDTSECF